MKRIAVITIAVLSFAGGLNIGRFIEASKAAPVINVTVNGTTASTSSTASQVKSDNLECSYSDYTRVGRTSLEAYEGSFTVPRETLKTIKYGDILEGRRVLQNNEFVSVPEFKLYMEDEKALGSMIIVRCK